VQELKLASLVHGGGEQGLQSLLECRRLGVEGGGEGLEFEERAVGRVFHRWDGIGSLPTTPPLDKFM
ncbi:MAG: hypothetical protein WBW48_03705, partial [Anaerolineae bacterium]